MNRPSEPDAGAAMVWALALCAVLVLVGWVGSAVALEVVQRARVAAVADLAAIAAAQTDGDACSAAQRVSADNGMRTVACGHDGADVDVTVEGDAPDLVARVLAALGHPAAPVRASARAGPP